MSAGGSPRPAPWRWVTDYAHGASMEGTAPTKLKLAEVEVARIGLGTNRLTKTPDHVAFVQEAVAAGVSLIDTAHTYAGGQSEDTIGTALSSMPGGCLVETTRNLVQRTLSQAYHIERIGGNQ